ncbi:hypothetical protein QW131_25315 [Roseibium salinum]|nr:hypothetical protein [Roseibium salinum]
MRRFKAREDTSYKQHKITDDDWRNRLKWDQYAVAAGDMIDRTSTPHAPWTPVSSEKQAPCAHRGAEDDLRAPGGEALTAGRPSLKGLRRDSPWLPGRRLCHGECSTWQARALWPRAFPAA